MNDASSEHYTVISADCHAGGSHAMYREYLDPEYRDDFDAWRNKYKNPFRDLQEKDGGRVRNWDDERRFSDEESGGVLISAIPPDVDYVKPLCDTQYDPLWQVCRGTRRGSTASISTRSHRSRPRPGPRSQRSRNHSMHCPTTRTRRCSRRAQARVSRRVSRESREIASAHRRRAGARSSARSCRSRGSPRRREAASGTRR
jgi:hypothetical protein